jgi:biopolymer transport protein ExbD
MACFRRLSASPRHVTLNGMSQSPARPLMLNRRFQFSLGTIFIVITMICVSLGVWVSRSRPPGAVSVTVVIPLGMEQKHAEVTNVLKALADVEVKAEVTRQQTNGVSAIVRARSDAHYKAVVRILEALQSAGVRKTTLSTQ